MHHPPSHLAGGSSPVPAPLPSTPFDLQPQEAQLLERTRKAAVGLGITGVLTVLTAYPVWLGAISAACGIACAVLLYQRTRNGRVLLQGRSGVCCCCHSPLSQLNAIGVALVADICGVIVTMLTGFLLLAASAVTASSTTGILLLFHIVFCAGHTVCCVLLKRLLRDVIADVYSRVEQDVAHAGPLSGIVVEGSAAPRGQHVGTVDSAPPARSAGVVPKKPAPHSSVYEPRNGNNGESCADADPTETFGRQMSEQPLRNKSHTVASYGGIYDGELEGGQPRYSPTGEGGEEVPFRGDTILDGQPTAARDAAPPTSHHGQHGQTVATEPEDAEYTDLGKASVSEGPFV